MSDRTMTTLRRLAGAATLAVVTLSLSACSQDIGDKVAEKIAEEQLGDGSDVDIDTDSGEVRLEDANGNSYVGGGQLPDDFPDDVPLVEGRVLAGAAVQDNGETTWTATIEVAGSVDDALAEAVRVLEGAGFELATEIIPGVPGAQLDNGTRAVVIAVFGDPSAETATIGYTVGASDR